MRSRAGKQAGFTLIELLITIPLAVVLMLAVIQTYIACARLIDSQRIRNNLAANVRTGMDYLTRDVSMAGYGLSAAQSALSQWLTWAPQCTNAVTVKNAGGTTPDMLWVAGAFERVSYLSEPVAAGAGVIRVPSNTIHHFNTSDKGLIYIGRGELARITGIAGNTLSISTQPSGAFAGLAWAHPSNAPVELVQVIAYSVTNNARNNYLIRSDPADPPMYYGSQVPWDNILAMDISNLQVARTNNNVYVTLSGQSAEADRNYHDSVTGDSFRRMTLSSEVLIRNGGG